MLAYFQKARLIQIYYEITIHTFLKSEFFILYFFSDGSHDEQVLTKQLDGDLHIAKSLIKQHVTDNNAAVMDVNAVPRDTVLPDHNETEYQDPTIWNLSDGKNLDSFNLTEDSFAVLLRT